MTAKHKWFVHLCLWFLVLSEVQRNISLVAAFVRDIYWDTDYFIVLVRSRKGIISYELWRESPQEIDSFMYFLRSVLVLVAQSCRTLYDPMDCGSPGSSVHGILQARILEKNSLLHRSFPTQVSCIAGRFFTIWATREDSVVITFMCPGKPRNLCDFLYYSGLEPNPQQLWGACIYGEFENMSLKDSATGGSCGNRKEMSAKEAPRRKGQEERDCCYCC